MMYGNITRALGGPQNIVPDANAAQPENSGFVPPDYGQFGGAGMGGIFSDLLKGALAGYRQRGGAARRPMGGGLMALYNKFTSPPPGAGQMGGPGSLY